MASDLGDRLAGPVRALPGAGALDQGMFARKKIPAPPAIPAGFQSVNRSATFLWESGLINRIWTRQDPAVHGFLPPG